MPVPEETMIPVVPVRVRPLDDERPAVCTPRSKVEVPPPVTYRLPDTASCAPGVDVPIPTLPFASTMNATEVVAPEVEAISNRLSVPFDTPPTDRTANGVDVPIPTPPVNVEVAVEVTLIADENVFAPVNV